MKIDKFFKIVACVIGVLSAPVIIVSFVRWLIGVGLGYWMIPVESASVVSALYMLVTILLLTFGSGWVEEIAGW